VIVQPESEAIKACDELIKTLKKSCPCKEYVFYISGKDNFRDKTATLHKYGGDRDKVAKPVWVKSIVDHLKTEYQAKIIDGLEGDDLVSVGVVSRNKKGQSAVHLGIDKDVKYGTQGFHYDWKAKQFIFTTPEEGTHYVYCQAIAGDATDGYYGIPGVGMSKAEKILEGCTTEREMYEAAVEAYRKKFGDYHKYESWDGTKMEKDPEGLFLENMNLAWILKEKDKFYKIPDKER
jgi:DNA polymerase-1